MAVRNSLNINLNKLFVPFFHQKFINFSSKKILQLVFFSLSLQKNIVAFGKLKINFLCSIISTKLTTTLLILNL